jgi:hypothetical protein
VVGLFGERPFGGRAAATVELSPGAAVLAAGFVLAALLPGARRSTVFALVIVMARPWTWPRTRPSTAASGRAQARADARVSSSRPGPERILGAYATQLGAIAFSRSKRVMSASCCSVRPMSSSPFIRQCLRNSSSWKEALKPSSPRTSSFSTSTVAR